MARIKKTPVVKPTIDKEKEELQERVKKYEDLLVRASHHVEELESQIENLRENLKEKTQEFEKHNKFLILQAAEKYMQNEFLIDRWMKDSRRKKHGK